MTQITLIRNRIMKRCFLIIFVLILLIVPSCEKADSEQIEVALLKEETEKLVEPKSDLLPFNIEWSSTWFMGGPNPQMTIEKDKIQIADLETTDGLSYNIVTYEVNTEKTHIPKILSKFKPQDFKGAYSIEAKGLKDGTAIIIKSSSCYYSFYLWDYAQLPKAFRKFRPLLEELNKIRANRKQYKIVKSVPFVK